MRVLHVINNLESAGAETLLTALSVTLRNAGVDVDVATLYRYSSDTLRNRLLGAGIPVHDLSNRARFSPRVLRSLNRTIANGTFDIVHAHLFPAFYWVALASKRRAIRLLTEHSPTNNRRGGFLMRPIESAVYRAYDGAVCISDTVKLALVEAQPAIANRVVTIPNGVDLGTMQGVAAERSSLGIPSTAPLVTFVARMGPPKDHETVLRALPDVPEAHLLLVGEGPDEPRLRALAAELQIADRVHFAGRRSDVPALLKASDVCVHSSHYEGFCLVLVEAMACGVPVVASDTPAVREVLGQSGAGEVFPVGGHATLAATLRGLLGNEAKRKQMAAAGPVRAQAFSIAETARQHIDLYEEHLRNASS